MATTHEIRAFFYTAQDARRAMNTLRRTTATVSGPEPLSEPQNGRAWLLTIEVGVGSSSGRYPNAMLTDQVVSVILKVPRHHRRQPVRLTEEMVGAKACPSPYSRRGCARLARLRRSSPTSLISLPSTTATLKDVPG